MKTDMYYWIRRALFPTWWERIIDRIKEWRHRRTVEGPSLGLRIFLYVLIFAAVASWWAP